jgi:hypothetical protein
MITIIITIFVIAGVRTASTDKMPTNFAWKGLAGDNYMFININMCIYVHVYI